jgi:hypothetical protein
MDTAPVNTPNHTQGRPGWMAIALIASFVLAAVVMFAIGARLVRRSPGPDVSAIAVVSFPDLTPAPGGAPFGTLFARQLAEVVSKTPGMHLVERPQAATLIEGRMQTSGNQLNVEIWLVRASDRRALWSKDYDFTPADSAAVQAQIVRAVATALHLQPAESAPK